MTEWHADDVLVEAYRDGATNAAVSYSLEMHLVRCARCRASIAARTDHARLDKAWRGVVAGIDAPRPRPIERFVLRLGVPDHVARLIAATPSLRASWLAAVSLALAFAVVAARSGPGGVMLFLVLAPLLPVAGVAAAYGPGTDPTYEIGLAAPMRSFRLLLIRSAAVLGTTTVLAGAAALFLPPPGWTVVAWLLPSLGLTTTSLALATVTSPLLAAGVVAGGWVAVAALVAAAARDALAAFHGPAQAGFAAVALAGVWVLASRRQRFDSRRTG